MSIKFGMDWMNQSFKLQTIQPTNNFFAESNISVVEVIKVCQRMLQVHSTGKYQPSEEDLRCQVP